MIINSIFNNSLAINNKLVRIFVEDRLIVRKNELNFKIKFIKFNKNNKNTNNLTTRYWCVSSGIYSLSKGKLYISVNHTVCESLCRVCSIDKLGLKHE